MEFRSSRTWQEDGNFRFRSDPIDMLQEKEEEEWNQGNKNML